MSSQYSTIAPIAIPGFENDADGVDMSAYAHLVVRRDELDRFAPTLMVCAERCVALMATKQPVAARTGPMCMSKAVNALWAQWSDERAALQLADDTPEARARMTTLLSVYVMHSAEYRPKLVSPISIMDGRFRSST